MKSNLVGINSRLDEIQASILDIKLGYLNKLIEKRINIAKQFNNKIDKQFNNKIDQIFMSYPLIIVLINTLIIYM